MSLLHKFVLCFFTQTVLCNLVFKVISFNHSHVSFLFFYILFPFLPIWKLLPKCVSVGCLLFTLGACIHTYIKLACNYDELRLPSEASLFHTPGSLETFPVKIIASLTPVPVQLLQNSEKQQHGLQCLGCTRAQVHTHSLLLQCISRKQLI